MEISDSLAYRMNRIGDCFVGLWDASHPDPAGT